MSAEGKRGCFTYFIMQGLTIFKTKSKGLAEKEK